MRPNVIPELQTNHNNDGSVTIICCFNDQYHVPVAGTKHLYFTYETKQEAFEKSIVIDKGIEKNKFSGRGYYIALPVDTKSGTICRCLGYHKPFYFEVKNDITENDIQEQKTYANSVSADKNRAIATAGEQNLVIVGCCDKVGSTIWLDTSRVKRIDDMEQPDWTYKSCIPLAF